MLEWVGRYGVFRWIWIIWVTVCCIQFCSSPPTEGSSPMYYIVQKGDTLDKIARDRGTSWQILWEANKETVPNPHLIYIGQRLIIDRQPRPVVTLTKLEKTTKLAKFMFNKAGLQYSTEIDLKRNIDSQKEILLNSRWERLASQRTAIDRIYIWMRGLEIWQLSQALVDLAPNEEKFYMLVGLAWQESHFVNRVGKHGEVGFFQFLPSTVKSFHRLDALELAFALDNLKNDPKIATCEAILMLDKWNWNWTTWNGGLEYQFHVNNKIYQFKQEWNRR